MGPSHLPDPYASAFISREVPGSFVRFHDDDDAASLAGSHAGAAGMGAGAAHGGGDRGYGSHNAYDDLSVPDDDYVDVQSGTGGGGGGGGYRGSRAYTATY
jgi:hypothetical protein